MTIQQDVGSPVAKVLFFFRARSALTLSPATVQFGFQKGVGDKRDILGVMQAAHFQCAT
jgi:hypothetical protein